MHPAQDGWNCHTTKSIARRHVKRNAFSCRVLAKSSHTNSRTYRFSAPLRRRTCFRSVSGIFLPTSVTCRLIAALQMSAWQSEPWLWVFRDPSDPSAHIDAHLSAFKLKLSGITDIFLQSCRLLTELWQHVSRSPWATKCHFCLTVIDINETFFLIKF